MCLDNDGWIELTSNCSVEVEDSDDQLPGLVKLPEPVVEYGR